MEDSVYISAFALRAPGLSTPDELRAAVLRGGVAQELEELLALDGKTVYLGKLALDAASPFYPRRSDLKVMRQDAIAAVVCSGELFAERNLEPSFLRELPLYVSTGAFIEEPTDDTSLVQRLARMAHVLFLLDGAADAEAQVEMLYQTFPPLLALRVLTNATESFVAQYNGVAGPNTTLGNTSHSGFYAVQEGVRTIRSGRYPAALIVSSNAGGIYSYLTFRSTAGTYGYWKESACAVALLLESEEGLRHGGRVPLARITEVRDGKKVPRVTGASNDPCYQSFDARGEAEVAVFSGGFTDRSFEAERAAAETLGNDLFSWYPGLGSLGGGSVLMNLAAATTFVHDMETRRVVCLDRDPYGRESLIEVAAA